MARGEPCDGKQLLCIYYGFGYNNVNGEYFEKRKAKVDCQVGDNTDLCA